MFKTVKMLGVYGIILAFGLPACGNPDDFLAFEPGKPPDSTLIKPKYDYEYIPDVSYKQMEERFSSMEANIPLHFNDNVKSFIDYFTLKNRDYTRMVARRKKIYFPLFEKYLKKHDLPTDLKYLAVVESGLNPKAESWAGAVGLWQFMPSTGRTFNLYQDNYIDERMDPEKATEAACKYLSNLYRYFNDWELALAAYNTGPGNVRRAMRRSGNKNNFWEVYKYLPRETRSYVPQLYAFFYVLNHMEEHNIYLKRNDYKIYTDTIQVDKYISLKALGDQLNVCEEDLARLNPELRQNIIPGNNQSYSLIIPRDVSAHFTTNKDSILLLAEKASKSNMETLDSQKEDGKEKITYKVKSGDVLGGIAEKFGVTTSKIRQWNNLGSNRIYVGQKLNIWLNKPVANSVNNNNKQGGQQSHNKENIYLVQPGDSLWSISKQYKDLTIKKIKQLNELKNNKIQPGQKLVIG